MANVREARALWAHQLHANLLNTIGAAILQSQVCEHAVRSSLPSSVDEVVRLGQMLRVLEGATRALVSGRTEPPRDLANELRTRAADFARAHPDIEVRQSIHDGGTALSRRLRSGAGVILTEALANAGRHAAPTAIDVHLTLEHGSLLLRVRDDGRGFDATARQGAGFGLAIMHEWAEALGGRLVVSSVPGRGTQVTLHAPLKQSDAHR
ncbi:MAG: sensor histidine kinase [bacterium]